MPASVLADLEPNDFNPQWAELTKEIVLAGEDVPRETGSTMRLGGRACCAWRESTSFGGRLTLLLRKLLPSRGHMARYSAERSSTVSASPGHYISRLTRALDLLGLSAKAALRGRLPGCRRRLRWHEWLRGARAGHTHEANHRA